jgi:hypothetical protein
MEFKVKTPNKPTNSFIFFEETGCHLFTKDDGFYVAGAATEEEAQALLDAHNPPAPTEPTIADKLAAAGLTVEELKEALGL